MPSHGRRGFSRALARTMWSCAAFFAIGYFLTALLKDVRPALVVSAVAAVPFGSRASSVWRGVLRGAGLGLIAGLGIAGGIALLYTREVPTWLLGVDAAVLWGDYAAWGGSMSFLASTSLCAALLKPYGQPMPELLTAVYVAAAVALTSMSAFVFALLAEKRRQRLEEQWEREP